MAGRGRLLVVVFLALAAVAALTFTLRSIYFSPVLSVAGAARPANQVNLNFQAVNPGYIKTMMVHVGDHVGAGAVLAKEDDRVAKLSLDASNANLAADQARLGQLQSPLTTTDLRQLDLAIAQARQAVPSAQQAVNDATAALASLQALQPNPVTSSYQRDLAAAQAAKNNAQRDLTNAQSQLALVENAKAVKTQPTTQSDIQAVQATISKDLALIALDQKALDDTVLTAPAAGFVTSIGGNVGDLVDPNGVRNFQGPAPLQQSQSTFQFLQPQPLPPSSASTQQFIPVMTFAVGSDWEVIAQVKEGDVTRLKPGERAYASFNALGGATEGATFVRVIPLPVQISSGVYYDVAFSLQRVPDHLLPGMSANVTVTPR